MSFGDPLELECQFLRLLRDPLTRLLMDANGVSEADLLALMCRIAAAQSGAAEPASPEQVCRYTALAGTKEREDAMNERPPIYTRKASINRPPRILVVEDETPLAELLAYNIKAEGFQVEHADRGDEAELRLVKTFFNLVILDWMLPGLSGLEICRRMREWDKTRDTPIIMLTARSEENERVRALLAGADDYVVKPFSMPELMLRVHAVLRRSRPERVATTLTLGDIDLDRVTRRVTRAGRKIHLGATEFRMLECFMETPNRVLTRAQLFDSVWGMSGESNERIVDVQVGRLRKALTREQEEDPIRTVRGAGYSFDEKLDADW